MAGAFLSNLLEDLTVSFPNGSPVIVLVDDYGARRRLVDALVEEARIFSIELHVASRLEEAMARLPTLSVNRNEAALLLIDAGAAESFGPWLDAAREALPGWVRFLLLVMLPEDIPTLAKAAPAFMSWAKSFEFRRYDGPHVLLGDDIQNELARLTSETGKTPREFVEAWRQGTLPDNFRNATWLTLAWAASDGDHDGPT